MNHRPTDPIWLAVHLLGENERSTETGLARSRSTVQNVASGLDFMRKEETAMTMRYRLLNSTVAGAAVFIVHSLLLAQRPPPARGATGQAAVSTPNLSGVWTPARGTRRGFGEVPEVPPMQPWAEAKWKAARESVDNPYEQGLDHLDPSSGVSANNCLPAGMPRLYNMPRPFEIVQVPGRVYIRYEWDHEVRRIYTDGRNRPEGFPPSYMGYSLGKWDGDTLVVETTDLDEKTWLDGLGHPHSAALRVIERFRRVNPETLEIVFLFEDPKAYAKPWGGKKVFVWRPDWEILEHSNCDEYWGAWKDGSTP